MYDIVLQEFFRVAIDSMAKNSLRCVAIACRTQELNQVPKEQEDLDKWALPEDELILLAIVGIKVCPMKLLLGNYVKIFLSSKIFIFLAFVLLETCYEI